MYFQKNTHQETPKVAVYTLGCKLNFSETSTITRDLVQRGFKQVDFSERADLYIVNTCSVTQNADRKCRKVIRRALDQSPDAFIAVMGCYSQLKPEEIADIDGVDLILGTKDKFSLINHLDSLKKKAKSQILWSNVNKVTDFIPSVSLKERTRAFLKIQDGCDYMCTFCTIPLARGDSRSNRIRNIIKTASDIANTTVSEIVLTGVNVGDFGRNDGETFFELIQQLDRVEGLDRIRISSIEPNLLSDDIISFVALSKRFVPHFHLPLQSGSNRILRLMKRRYTKEFYATRVRTIKRIMPDCCIGVDVLVGFPGETERDFRYTFDFLSELEVSYLHVFTYSPRLNTDAIRRKQSVGKEKKSRRSKLLHDLSDQKRWHFYNQHISDIQPVLFETYHKGILTGLTKNYIRVEVEGERALVRRIADVRLLSNHGRFIRGELLP